MEVGAFVLLDVNGADFYLVKGNAVCLHFQQHIGFVLKAVAGHLGEKFQGVPGESAQAGLGIGQGNAAEQLEHRRGGLVAEAAAGRHMGQGKIPAAQGDAPGFQGMLTAGAGVFGVVLIVAVHGDHGLPLGAVLQKPGECRLEGSALAPVDLVVKQLDFGMGCGGIGKVVKVFRLASVVDQDDVGKALAEQTVNHGVQLFVRVKRGENDGNV